MRVSTTSELLRAGSTTDGQVRPRSHSRAPTGAEGARELEEPLDAVAVPGIRLEQRGEPVVVDRGAGQGPPDVLRYMVVAEAHLVGQAEGTLDAHAMDPVRVLGLAKVLGSIPPRVLVVGCEPGVHLAQDDDELLVELSAPVAAATSEAVVLVESVLAELLESRTHPPEGGGP